MIAMTSDFRDLHIATMTFHVAHNYGAMLQAYALQKAIEGLGANCEILDYRLPWIFNRDGISTYSEYVLSLGFLKGNIRFFWRHLNGWYRNLPLKKIRFDSFMRENLKLSPKVYFQKSKLSQANYDAVFFGSDQIWNPNLTGGFAGEYFGEFFDEKKTALISYAASCGKDRVEPEYKEEIIRLLKRFSAVSVREGSFAKYLTEECGITTQTVLDPVFLLNRSAWEALEGGQEKQVKEPYLLLYTFDAGTDIYDIALRVAKERGLKLIAICYKRSDLPKEIEQIDTCGPKEFLNLFLHADFFCTTSFHGLAFSILLEKNFYCMAHPAYGQRERDLVEMMGLQARRLEHASDLEIVTDCDYSLAHNRIEENRTASLAFIEKALQKTVKLHLKNNE